MASDMIERVALKVRVKMVDAFGYELSKEESATLARAAIEALTTDDLLKELDRRLGSTPVEE